MSNRDKPQWVAKKYMGDDQYSWAVVDKRYLPRGHRGVIYEYLPECAVSYNGLSRDNAKYYVKVKKAELKNS
jgi:hypothetical protein